MWYNITIREKENNTNGVNYESDNQRLHLEQALSSVEIFQRCIPGYETIYPEIKTTLYYVQLETQLF